MNGQSEFRRRSAPFFLALLLLTSLGACRLDILQRLTAAEISVELEGVEIGAGGFYNFGTVLCDESLELSCTIRNNGADDLSLEGEPFKVLISGANAALFTVSPQPPAVIGAGEEATFAITFLAATEGIKTAKFEIPNSDGNEGSYGFTITGTAAAVPEPDISLRTSTTVTNGDPAFSIGSTTVGTPLQKVFYIDNVGTVDLTLTGSPTVELGASSEFSIIDYPNNATIGSGATDSFTIEYDPAAVGTHTVSVSIGSNDPDENPFAFTIEASATAAPVPDIDVLQDVDLIAPVTGSFGFGSVLVGSQSAGILFTIENPGTADLTLTGTPYRVALGGSDPTQFTVSVQPGTPVSASSSTTFTMRFNPTSTDAKSATVSIDNNVSGKNPYTFTVTGTGIAPEINVKQGTTSIVSGGSYAFADTAANTSAAAVTFTIENLGTSTLNLSGNPRVSVSGGDAAMFTVTSQPAATVTAGGSTTFAVAFAPTGIGAKSAVLSIANDDAGENPYVVNVSGDSLPWVRTYAGTGYDWMPAMEATSDGGFAMLGFSDISGSGNYDYWVVKAAASGAITWQKAFGGGGSESPMAIRQTSDGGYIVGGYTDSFGAGNNDAWILKLTGAGGVTWQKAYGTTSNENIYDIVEADGGGYVAIGYSGHIHAMKLDTSGNISWQKIYGGSSLDGPRKIILREPDKDYLVVGHTLSWGAGNTDIWVFRMTKTGSVYANTYNKAYGGSGYDYPRSVIQTGDGGYLVVGYTESFGAGGQDGWILKLAGNLNVSWQKAYGGSAGDEILWDVRQTADGGYIVVGETDSYGGGYADAWVLKLASDGTVQWQKTYGGSGNDIAKSVRLAPSGGYIVGGDTYSFGAGSNKANMLLMHLDTDGSPVYTNLGENLSLGQNTTATVTNTAATVTNTDPPGFTVTTGSYGAAATADVPANTSVTPTTHYP
jgi:phage gp45-like